MITYCPECKAKYDLPDSRKGVKFRCKMCGATVYTDDLRRVECLDPFGLESAKPVVKPAPRPAAQNLPGVKPATQAFESHSKLDAMEDDLFDFSDTRSMSGDLARQAVEEAEAEARKTPKPAAPAAAKPTPTAPAAPVAPASAAKAPAVKPAAPASAKAPAPQPEPKPAQEPTQETKAEKTAIFKSEPLPAPQPQEPEEDLFDFGEDAPQTTVSQQQVAAMPDEGFGEDEDDLIDFGNDDSAATATESLPAANDESAIAADAFGFAEEPVADGPLALDEELSIEEEPLPAAEEAMLIAEEPVALEELEVEEELSLAEAVAEESAIAELQAPQAPEESAALEELEFEEDLSLAEEALADAPVIAEDEKAVGLEELAVEEALVVEEELVASEPLIEEELEESPATVEEIALAAAGTEDFLIEEDQEPVASLPAEEPAPTPALAADEPVFDDADDLLAEELEPATAELAALDGDDEPQPGIEAEPLALEHAAEDAPYAFDAQTEVVALEEPETEPQPARAEDAENTFDDAVFQAAPAADSDFAQAVARWRKVIHDDNDLEFINDDPAELPEAPVVDLHALFPPRKREVRAVCSACNARYHLPGHYSGRRKLRCAVCSQPVAILQAGEEFPPLPALSEVIDSPADSVEERMVAAPEPVESQALAEAEAVAAVEAFEAEVVADAEAEAVVETFEEEEALPAEPAQPKAEAAAEPDEVELDLGELDAESPQEAQELDLDAALEEEAAANHEQPAAALQEDDEKSASSRRPQRMEIKPRPKAGEEDDSLFDFGDATGLANVITGSDSSVFSPITNDTAAEMKKKKKADGELDDDLIDWE